MFFSHICCVCVGLSNKTVLGNLKLQLNFCDLNLCGQSNIHIGG